MDVSLSFESTREGQRERHGGQMWRLQIPYQILHGLPCIV